MTQLSYTHVTEVAGEWITSEQLCRMYTRYKWAAQFCLEKDVVEVACGTAPGLGLIGQVARSVVASDVDKHMVSIAKKFYGNRFEIANFDALNLPFETSSKDVVIIFEALYYLPCVDTFIKEVKRVLKPRGKLLVATANKDLPDFNPSVNSVKYYGVSELTHLALKHKMEPDFYGQSAISNASLLQKMLKFLKIVVVRLNLMPKTMRGKEFLKRLVFGKLVRMPFELCEKHSEYDAPISIPATDPNCDFKVILFVSTKL